MQAVDTPLSSAHDSSSLPRYSVKEAVDAWKNGQRAHSVGETFIVRALVCGYKKFLSP